MTVHMETYGSPGAGLAAQGPLFLMSASTLPLRYKQSGSPPLSTRTRRLRQGGGSYWSGQGRTGVMLSAAGSMVGFLEWLGRG